MINAESSIVVDTMLASTYRSNLSTFPRIYVGDDVPPAFIGFCEVKIGRSVESLAPINRDHCEVPATYALASSPVAAYAAGPACAINAWIQR